MASSLKTTLIDTDFKHWLKGALAVLFAREGLVDFVENEIIAYQIDLLNDVRMLSRIPPRTICSSCTTANILVCPATGFCCWKNNKCNMHDPSISSSMPDQPCPVGLCTALRDAIRNEHRYRGPSWRNTDTTKWCTDAYQIAKNFMPPDGYSDNASFAETDFNGVLAVVMNNKRFQKKMSTNLSNKSNICEEARKAGRKIRHAPKHQLKYTELVSCIDVFIQLLSDDKCLATDAKAKDAVNKLNQLKTNTLMIYADDITKVLNDFIKEKFDDQQNKLINEIDRHFRAHEKDSIDAIDRKVQDLANTHIDKLKSQTEKGIAELTKHEEKGKVEIYNYTSIQIKKEKDELHAHTEKEKEGLSLYNKQLKQELEDKSVVLYSRTVNEVTKEIHEETERVKQELDTHSKKLREEANKSALLNTGKTDDQSVKGEENTISLFEWFWDLLPFKEYQLRSELKEALARFYLEKESMIPASPLVEDHAVPLAELYVQPPMSAFIKPNAFGQGKSLAQTTTVSSYQKLFLNHDNVLFKNIYVEANAGYGKTSFTQKVAMTWCQAQKPDHSLNSKFVQNDVDTLERFELLFLLHLRDFQGEEICDLGDLIFNFVSQNLPDKDKFSKEFIVRMLQTRTCLAIIDGLDEWVHPEKCTRTPGIPHNLYGKNCTVLTTTRPWKLSTIGLQSNLIDRHVEISKLDDETSEVLKSNAVILLNKNKGQEKRDLTDFNRKVSKVNIGDIHLIPYILLQLICIWFDGANIGKSKCETYSNTVELTLERGFKRRNAPKFLTENTKRIVSVPKCMSHNVLCNQYADLLLKLGQLAFHTFFQDIKETSLVIESTTVLKFLSNQELEFCLKIGLLSQTKDKSLIAVKRYKVFFQHKSVQDFLAALYVTSEWKNGTIKTTIIQVCSSLSGILEMENIFVFVCGMNSDVYKCISGELQKIVDLDSVTIRYRTYMYIDAYDRVSNDDKRMMMSYQSMQLQCFQESERNGNESCSVPLCDILLDDNRLTDDDLTALKTIIHINKGNVKSLQSFKRKNIFMKSLDPGVFTSLETLRLYESFDEPEWLADILTESALTLKCLTLSGYESISLSDISITALTGLKCLQSLCLRHITITHSNLERLYTYINHITTLTRIQMEWIDCSNHKKKHNDCEITVDLLLLKELERVELVMVKMSPESWSILFLSVGQLHVPRSITVKLTWILMTSKEWRDLLLSVGRLPQSVTVELKWCKGPSEDVWKSIVEEIRSTPKLSLLPEISIDMWGEASLTLKNH